MMQIQRGTKSEGHHDAFLFEDAGSVIRTLPAHTDGDEKHRENENSYSEVEEQCRISSGINKKEERLVDDGGFHHQDMIEKVLQDDPSFSPSPPSNIGSSLAAKPRVPNQRVQDPPGFPSSPANGNLIHTEIPLNPTHPIPFRAHAHMGGYDHPLGISFDSGYGHNRFYPVHQPTPHMNTPGGPMPFYPPHGMPPHAMCPPDFGISAPMVSHSYPPYAGIYPTGMPPHHPHPHHHAMHGVMRAPSTNPSSNGIIIPVMQDNTNRQTICVRALCAAAVVIYRQGQIQAVQQQAS